MDYADFERRVKRLDPSDTCIREIDGEPMEMLSLRGMILIVYQAWVQDNNPKCQGLLLEYCRHINQHGYSVGAAKALSNLSKMTTAQGKQWITSTFDKYVTDQTRLLKAMGFRPAK